MSTSKDNPPPTEYDAVTEVIAEIESGAPVLSLNQVFESFDPKDGEVQDFWLSGITARARGILASRSADEIREAVMLAEWMVQQPLPLPSLIARKEFETIVGLPNESLARILSRRMAYFDIVGVEDPRDVTWPEIFAAISLTYVALSESGGQSELAMVAVEAVCIAETLRDQDQAIADGVKEQISVRARKGGRAKAKMFDELRSRAEEFWEGGDFKTFTDAAEAFIDTEKDIIKTLPGEHSKRTVTGWISKYEKLPGSRKRSPRARR